MKINIHAQNIGLYGLERLRSIGFSDMKIMNEFSSIYGDINRNNMYEHSFDHYDMKTNIAV